MIPGRGALSSKLNLETLTDINIELNISLLLKELILDNIFSVVAKLLFQLEMSFQLTILLKVQLFAILNLLLVIKDHIQDALVHMQLLSDILMTAVELESDSHQEPEKPFLAAVELQLE
jgi:hypothetical protein